MKSELISGDLTMVNQILPHKNRWAWDLFLKGQANNWVPTEIPMGKDIEQWRSKDALTEDERLLFRRCLGFFAGSESLVSNNLLLNVFRFVTDGECRQYILRQAYEEALHNQTIVYVCDSLDLDVDEVYEAYRNVPAIKAKDDFMVGITSDIGRPDFHVIRVPAEPDWDLVAPHAIESYRIVHKIDMDRAIKTRQEVLRSIITYYLVCEGLFFYAGFAMLLSFKRNGKMPGVSEQIEYTLRDEAVHVEFGTSLVNAIKAQSPEVWTEEFKGETVEHVRKATELEIAYVHDVLPRGVLGLNAELFVGYMQYIANRRLESVGLSPLFKNPKNPFPWLAETIDLPKQKNFFETRVTEYAAGSLQDDL